MQWAPSNIQTQQPWNKNKMVVPFKEDTGTLHLDSGWRGYQTWFEVIPFQESLKITSHSVGNGHAKFKLSGDHGFVYQVSLNDFVGIIKEKNITNGWIEPLLWTFKKVGDSYLLTPILV